MFVCVIAGIMIPRHSFDDINLKFCFSYVRAKTAGNSSKIQMQWNCNVPHVSCVLKELEDYR